MLKRDAPGDVVARVGDLEARADAAIGALEINALPRGLASWATLVFAQYEGAKHRSTQGLTNNDAAMINLSHRGALILSWLRDRGSPSELAPDDFVWIPNVERVVADAWSVASNYSTFLLTFPMWHRNRIDAVLQQDGLRFTVPGGAPGRRVSAFQKGIRPPTRQAADAPGLRLSSEQERAVGALLDGCIYVADEKVAYSPDIGLYRLLKPTYADRLDVLFRRADDRSLGPYTIGQVKHVYSALLAVCAVHEDVSHHFGVRGGRYPLNSCVMVKPTTGWLELIVAVSDCELPVVEAIIQDLTAVSGRVWDLHVQPFIPVDAGHLALAPQFVLNSRADENILRVCGQVRPEFFDVASSAKEEEMLEALASSLNARFAAQLRIPLPAPLPDIDLLLADENTGVVAVAELKWLRKPSGWSERIARDADFAKGLRQLAEIRAFLHSTPSYLVERGKLARSLETYEQVRYLLIARDHFRWSEGGDTLVVDFDVARQVLAQPASLGEMLANLERYDWLPEEGRDFEVRFEQAVVNGVTLEHEVFYGTR